MTEHNGPTTEIVVRLPLEVAEALEAVAQSENWSGIDSVVIAALGILLLGKERPATREAERVSHMHSDLTAAIHSAHDSIARGYAQLATHLDEVSRDLAEFRQRLVARRGTP